MSEYNKTILTNQGLDLMARANTGTAKFTITRAATSTEQLANKSMADLQQLTELPSLMQYGVINDVADSTQDKSIVIGTELLFNNKDLSNSYNINAIGLFAKEDEQDKEILYAITTAVIPESMPDYKNKVLFKFSLTMFVAVGRTDNVSVIGDDSNSATKADLTKVKKELDGKANIADVYTKDEVNELVESAGKVKTVNGQNGDITIPVFAPNLLIGTSDEWEPLDYVNTIWNQKISVQQGDIISVSTILDTTKSTSAAIYIRMLNDSGGAVKDYIKGATVTSSIGTSQLTKLVIPAGVTSIQYGIMSDDRTNFASVKYKERKLAKWRNASTPPDMTWLPNVDDNTSAINDLKNQVTELSQREIIHQCDDIPTGTAYSKAHPNVIVATP